MLRYFKLVELRQFIASEIRMIVPGHLTVPGPLSRESTPGIRHLGESCRTYDTTLRVRSGFAEWDVQNVIRRLIGGRAVSYLRRRFFPPRRRDPLLGVRDKLFGVPTHSESIRSTTIWHTETAAVRVVSRAYDFRNPNHQFSTGVGNF